MPSLASERIHVFTKVEPVVPSASVTAPECESVSPCLNAVTTLVLAITMLFTGSTFGAGVGFGAGVAAGVVVAVDTPVLSTAVILPSTVMSLKSRSLLVSTAFSTPSPEMFLTVLMSA